MVKKDIKVTVYDNYFTGTKENHIHGVKYVRGHTSEILSLKNKEPFSHIFHFGEYSRVEQSFDDIDIVFEYNLGSIYQILKFAKLNNAKLIYSGSSTKFGDSGETIYQSPYALTKKINTEIIKTYSEWFNLEYAIAYFYNVYGKREISSGKYATLIAKYAHLHRNGHEKLPVVLPGTQKRNFTDIRDIISGLELIGDKGTGDGFGIGAREAYSIVDIVRLFNKEPEYLPERKGNRLTAPVLTELTEELGWKQQFFLEDYIKDIITN